jgi:hypothetical protein
MHRVHPGRVGTGRECVQENMFACYTAASETFSDAGVQCTDMRARIVADVLRGHNAAVTVVTVFDHGVVCENLLRMT